MMPSNVVSVSSSHHQTTTTRQNNDDDLEIEQQQQQDHQQINSISINNNNNSSSSPSSPQSSYNSSYGSNSGKNLINHSSNSNISSLNNSSSITALVPGGVVTTQNISTVIRPKGNTNSLQFVKIQTPELSKKAVEQIKLAEETKISKSKIKEVEEEWQNNLLNWKSKRRQQFSHTVEHEPNNLFETSDSNGGRKIKTFAEMIEQRAKSGNRLGFHLQRYISTEDEEAVVVEDELVNDAENGNGDVLLGESRDDLNNHHKENFSNNTENESKIRLTDSDYEVQSSTSSSYNQLDSKSPSSPEIQHQQQQNQRYGQHLDNPRINNSSTTSNCDNNNIPIKNIDKYSHDERDYQMSLVNASETEQLNSTFKQNLVLNQSITLKEKDNIKLTPRLDVDIRNNEVSETRSEEDESDNSTFEEEEEEEQKHLQRIAFEAKLKAFERLTEPSPVTPKPKQLTNRITIKAPNTAPTVQNKPAWLENTNTSFEERQKLTPPVKTFKDKPNPLEDRTRSNNRYIEDNRLQTTLSNLVAPSSPRRIEISHQPMIQQQQPNEYQQVDQMQQQQKQSPLPPPLPELRNQVKQEEKTFIPPQPLPYVQPSQRVAKSPPKMMINDNNNQRPVLTSVPQVVDMVQKPKVVSSGQQNSPEQTKNPLSSQRKHSKEDKDRTVLSVSGKKRCSSCKEELGRGAAAFVVESLSLVYHTNCFRCSVCHVNLSNGFRGVDVRVHAGALHCQNCYSRDGLNFSRV